MPARAEIIPFEPEQGNACEGRDKTAYIFLRLTPPLVSSPDKIIKQEMYMELQETVITRAIVETFMKKLSDSSELDVAIVGGGPAGLVAAHRLAAGGKKVALFEKKLSIGGGMWGGGMLFNEIVVQEEGRAVLNEYGIRSSEYQAGYYTADAVESVTTLASAACRSGAGIFNCMTVEDVVIRESRVCGLVINWTPVEMAGLHVDPLTISADVIVDCTGHDTEVLKVISRKADVKLFTESGSVMGERSMWAEKAERLTLENTREVFSNVYVAGMSANAAFGGPRMGPIFGGMLLSGCKVAEMILKN